MLSPAPDQVHALVNHTALTPEQKIVRETTFYRENIAPLIIGDAGNDKPIVFIEERTTTNSGADTASKVAAYYQEMQLVADLAGHGDFFKNKKIIFIINKDNYHWTASVKEKDADNIVERADVTTDGTCGLSSALIACDEILKTPSNPNETKYQSAIGELYNQPSNNAVILNHVPAGKNARVERLLRNKSSANWLETDDIRDIIIHNEGANSQLFQSHNSSNAQNRQNQINFATALNNSDLNSYADDFSDLLPSGINHYRSVQYFYEELDQTKLQDFLNQHSIRTDLTDEAKKNLYKICEQYSLFKEDDEKIKFDLGDGAEKTAIDQEIYLLKNQREEERKKEEENKQKLTASSDIAIKYFRESFDKDKYANFISNTSDSLSPDYRFDEKLLISFLFYDIKGFEALSKKDLPSLPQNILKIIVPKSCQPETQDYKGWGKIIDSKTVDEQTTLSLNGNKIKSIKIDGTDKLQEILELKNPYLINCAILDLFRNTDNKDITVEFTNNKSKQFSFKDRKTIIGNQIVENPTPKEEALLTETHLDVAKRIYAEKISDEDSFPNASPDDFENIKKHIEKRFRLLEDQLKASDSKAIIVIPGSYDANGNFKHTLGTDRAVRQWGNKIYSDEIIGIIDEKIKNLKDKNPGKILFGNVGTEIVEDGKTFYPQFPVGDQKKETWGEFEGKFKANIAKMTPEAKQALIKNYEINLNLPIFSISNLLYNLKSDDDKLNDILTHLKTNFADKNFIHVWGANAKNWNLTEDSVIDGGGQATAFKTQKPGVFGIVTTPVEGSALLMKKCKTYGSPSVQPTQPQAVQTAPPIIVRAQ